MSGSPRRALALIWVALVLVACRGGRGNEVVVAALVARTGARAPWGEDLFRGMELAVEHVNARGGVGTRRVRFVTVDHGSREDHAGDVVARMIQRESPVAVFGEVATVATERAAIATQRRGVPFIVTGATARDLTRTGDFVFRSALSDTDQAAAMARYARQVLQRRHAAIAYRRNSILHLNVADAFARAFRAVGGDVVLRETFADDDTEMVELAAAVRRSNADVLYVPAYANDAARVALAVRHGHVTAQVLGTDGWIAPEVRRIAAEAAVGVLVTDAFAPDAPRAAVEQFVQSFRLRYRAAPGTFAAIGYDAMRWVLAVASRVPLLEPRSLRDALAGSRFEDGVTGPLAVDQSRVLARPVNVLRVEREGFSFVAAANP